MGGAGAEGGLGICQLKHRYDVRLMPPRRQRRRRRRRRRQSKHFALNLICTANKRMKKNERRWGRRKEQEEARGCSRKRHAAGLEEGGTAPSSLCSATSSDIGRRGGVAR